MGPGKPGRASKAEMQQRQALSDLMQLERLIEDKESVGHPGKYGLPDLLFPRGFHPGIFDPSGQSVVNKLAGAELHDEWVREPLDHSETDEEYQKRQNEALSRFITDTLFIIKDARKIHVQTIPVLLQWVSDVFYVRVNNTITWKPRGGGGSLTAAVLIWLLAVYKKRSVLDLAGSADQARIVYDYVTEFWDAVPGLKEGLVDGDPLRSVTRLKTGVVIKCLLPGTTVMSDRGLIPIEDVVVGDRVLDGSGEFKKVKGISSRAHDGPVVRIHPNGAMPVTVTPDHKVYSYLMSKKERNSIQAKGWKSWEDSMPEAQWHEAQDLKARDLVYMPNPRSPKVENRGKLVLKDKIGDGRTDRHLSPVTISDDLYRFLGYWLAEGSTSEKQIDVNFHRDESVYIDDVVSLTKSVFGSSPCVIRKDNKAIVHFGNKPLAEWFHKNGGCKEHKRIPFDMVLGASDSQLENLLIGLLRGDGCATESYGNVRKQGRREQKREVAYSSISPHIAQIVYFAALRLGMYPSVHGYHRKPTEIRGKKYNRKPHFQVRFSGEDCERLQELCAMYCKTDRYAVTKKTHCVNEEWISTTIRKTESFDYQGEVYDITVDGEPSFTSPYILLHNCVPATEKQARGKHFSTIFVDELCQSDPRVERAMRAAVQGALSEEDPLVCLFSTFHIPHGMFQEYWDGYEDKGFARYHWNCFDTLQKCTRGMEHATEEDPKALEFCKQCFLTDKKIVKDFSWEHNIEVLVGCKGKARNSSGWATFENMCKAKKTNIGTMVFECEFSCDRPSYESCVYPPELIDNSLIDPVLIDPNTDRVSVGIDWGIQTEGSLAVIMVVRKIDYVYVSDIVFTDHKLVSDVSEWLSRWQTKFGQFGIVADASHPFNNAELKQAGYDIRPASFGSWKKIGIENVSKYLAMGRLRINRSLDKLIGQLKSYRRSSTTGNIVKKDDHGPDALMVAMLNFRFEDEFGDDIAQAAVLDEQTRLLEAVDKEKEDRTFNTEAFEGAIPRAYVPQYIDPDAVMPKSAKDNVLVF